MIGRFKRYLKERCPECRTILQVRVKEIKAIQNGNQVYISEEYVSCSNCGYTEEMEQKRIRRQEDDDLTF